MSRRVAHNDVPHDLRAAGRYANGVSCIPVLRAMGPGAPGFARA